MILQYFGKTVPIETLRILCHNDRTGTTFLSLAEVAEGFGLRTLSVSLPFAELYHAKLPCLVQLKQSHFVVLYEISSRSVMLADPAEGKVRLNPSSFCEAFNIEGKDIGYAILFELTDKFVAEEATKDESPTVRLMPHIKSFIIAHRQNFLKLASVMAGAICLQMLLPFVTKELVDTGIDRKNIKAVYIVLLSQFMISIGRTTLEFIKARVLLTLSTIVSNSLMSDFLHKLTRLPLSYFESTRIGDTLQRANDTSTIQQFVTNTAFEVCFAALNVLIFGAILAYFNYAVAIAYFVFTAAQAVFAHFVAKRRRHLNRMNFRDRSQLHTLIVQVVCGMAEIKLNNCARIKHQQWFALQQKVYESREQSLWLDQLQNGGGMLLNEGRSLAVSLFASTEVISGNMTLGMMMSTTYIIGYLTGPMSQLISLVRTYQEAQVSLERLEEVHNMQDEEPKGQELVKSIAENRAIRVENVSFSYPGKRDRPALDSVSFEIPHRGVTAIVGSSGSGKSTIMKLLLGIYAPSEGHILIGETPLSLISLAAWRDKCGVVFQDGFVFEGSIASNIALRDAKPICDRVRYAAEIARIDGFVQQLPMGYESVLGVNGIGLSQGQKQRLLIARAVYGNPEFLFFDEATSALDSDNEHNIMCNLKQFLNGRTAVIIAHRLSTVRHADQVVVLEAGRVVEVGMHSDLVARSGAYYSLIQNQLEL